MRLDEVGIDYGASVEATFSPQDDAVKPAALTFIGRRGVFQHLGTATVGPHAGQAMMQVPRDWDTRGEFVWVPACDLEI